MALKARLPSVEGLDESVAGLYRQEGGTFVLDVEAVDGWALENVTGLKTALGSEREGHRKAADALKAYGEITPDKVTALQSRVQELEAIDPGAEATRLAETQFESKRQQMVDAHQKELEQVSGDNQFLMGQINRMAIDSEAARILSDPDVKGNATLLLPHIRQRTRIRRVEDRFVVDVLDATGTPRIKDAEGNAMTLKDLVLEMREDATFGAAFQGSGNSGSGTPPSKGGMPTGAPTGKSLEGAKGRDLIQRSLEHRPARRNPLSPQA